MSREIKFRAWRGNKMVQVDQITMGENTWICNGGIGISIPFQPSIPLMQYTGLKDKNGKEIYEGDIVKTDFKQDGSHESIQVIEFYEGAFGSRNKDDHFRIPALFSGRSTEGMNTNYYEIIGNIHQNPELLKGDQQNG